MEKSKLRRLHNDFNVHSISLSIQLTWRPNEIQAAQPQREGEELGYQSRGSNLGTNAQTMCGEGRD
jgi:hypothetical protein